MSDIVLFESPESMSAPSVSEVYERLDFEDPEEYPKFKQIRFRALSFLRDHYLKIIATFFILIIFLIIVIAILGINLTWFKNNQNALALPYNYSMKSDLEQDEVSISPSLMKTPFCKKIKCAIEICQFDEIKFMSLRRYSCCCLPDYYIYKSYENVNGVHSIILQDTRLDPKDLSDYDLDSLPQLQNLRGEWNVVQLSDSVYYMKYVNIKIATPLPPPETD